MGKVEKVEKVEVVVLVVVGVSPFVFREGERVRELRLQLGERERESNWVIIACVSPYFKISGPSLCFPNNDFFHKCH